MNPLDALTASPFLIIVLITVGYALTCAAWPFGDCRRCNGTGKRRSIFGGRSFRICPRCHGNGRRLRIGQRVINYLRRLGHDARH